MLKVAEQFIKLIRFLLLILAPIYREKQMSVKLPVVCLLGILIISHKDEEDRGLEQMLI